MSPFAFYPINRIDGRCRLLAYARILDEGSDVEIPFLVDLDPQEDQEEADVIYLGSLEPSAADAIEEEVMATGTDRSHVNWTGFEALGCFARSAAISSAPLTLGALPQGEGPSVAGMPDGRGPRATTGVSSTGTASDSSLRARSSPPRSTALTALRRARRPARATASLTPSPTSSPCSLRRAG